MEWISVKDRLPADDEECLVAFKIHESFVYALATYFEEEEVFSFWNVGTVRKYGSHWMPLPEPPKEE